MRFDSVFPPLLIVACVRMKDVLMRICSLYCVTTLTLICVSGCGNNNGFEVAPVSGTVRCGGKLLTDGLVVFTPVAGCRQLQHRSCSIRCCTVRWNVCSVHLRRR